MPRSFSVGLRVSGACLAALALAIAYPASPGAVSSNIVISQVYGGGGNGGATIKNDFIELFNRGSAPADVSGWSVQYASSTGTSWAKTDLSGIIPAGGYYLVQEAQGTGGTVSLPTPNATGTIAMSATAGKVALVSTTTSLTGTCPSGVIDFVGFGTAANCFEGAGPTSTLANATAALRNGSGCIETDNNNTDFTVTAPTPRNSASPTQSCTAPPVITLSIGDATVTEGDSGTTSATFSVSLNGPAPAGGVTFDIATADNTATVANNDYVIRSLTGQAISAGQQTYTFTVLVNGDTALELDETFFVNVSNIAGASLADGQAIGTIINDDAAPAANVVISQVYGGGGNSGATLKNDFIELHNRETFDVPVTGWTVQYGAARGTSWQTTPLAGTIPAGGYYLVKEAAGTGGSVDLPPADATGTIAMAAGAGKVALVARGTALPSGCPAASAALDLVGYGSTANCFEGTGPAPGLANDTAAIRAGLGDIDTNVNAADFFEGTPSPRSTRGIFPTARGSAVPAGVASGGATLLTVTVTPGAVPPSTSFIVTGDLSPIGGYVGQAFHDDGLAGDVTAGDRVFSLATTVTGAPGFFTIPVSAIDDVSRTVATTIRLAVEQTTTTPISFIQGIASTSTLQGQFVTTTGVVTALRSNGYFIQTPDAQDDGNPQSSEGLFVFTGSSPALVAATGDFVRVSGNVNEFASSIALSHPTTELGGGPLAVVVTSGNALPDFIDLTPAMMDPAGDIEQLERFEGMRVRADLEVIAPTDGNTSEASASSTSTGDFYAVVLGTPRPMREPGIEPGQVLPAGSPCCVPVFDGNPERLRVDSDGLAGAAKLEVVSGQRMFSTTGVLDHGGPTYTLLPYPSGAIPTGNAAAVPVGLPSENEVTIASFNMERFFDTTDDAGVSDVPMTPAAFDLRLTKASLAIRNVMRMPDILGVEEVENIGVLEALATRINDDAVAAGGPNPGYVAHLIEGHDIGGINVGVLAKGRVTLHSVTQIGADAMFNGAYLNDRPSLDVRADITGPSGLPFPVTVIVNHLRSLLGIDDPVDGARVREKRKLQAEMIAGYIQDLQAANPAERIVSVGDYNAFQFSDGYVDVIGAIKGTPSPADQVVLASGTAVAPELALINVVETLSPEQRYSFVFDGNAQAIDHVLVNRRALTRFSRMQYARNNADFPESLRGDGTRPERFSDHDMPVAYFVFFGAPIVTLNGNADITIEAYQPWTDPGASASDEDLGVLPVNVSGATNPNVPGDYLVTYTATNGYQTTSVTRTVHVLDRTAPALNGLALSPGALGPPNHKMVDVAALYTATDASGVVSCSVGVTSNEPINGLGDGNTSVDWQVLDAHHLRLRAERSGLGTGRIYTVTLTCADPSGNVSTASAVARVAK